jgi:hypothetical protein
LASEKLVFSSLPLSKYIVLRHFSKLVFCKPQGASFEKALTNFLEYKMHKVRDSGQKWSDSDHLWPVAPESFESASQTGLFTTTLGLPPLPSFSQPQEGGEGRQLATLSSSAQPALTRLDHTSPYPTIDIASK